MKLFLYEIKKIYKNKGILLLLVFFLLLNIASGIIGIDEIRDVNYEQTYSKRIDSVIYNAKINYLQIEDKESENAKYQLHIMHNYSQTQTLDISGEVIGYGKVLGSPIPYVSALLVCLAVSILLANIEYTSDIFILSHKRKRINVGFAKLAAVLVTTISTVVLFVCLTVLGCLLSKGLHGLNSPIQCIPQYIFCPYTFTVFEAICSRVLLCIGIITILSLTVLAISFIVRRFVPALLCSVLLLGFDYLLTYANKDTFAFFRNINVNMFVTDLWLKQYNGMELLTFASNVELFAIISVILIAILMAVSLVTFRYMRSIKAVKTKRQAKTLSKYLPRNVLFYESKKLLSGRILIVVLCLFLIHILSLHITTKEQFNDYDKTYKYYVTQMSEMTYNEQISFSTTEKIKANEIIVQAKEIESLFFANEETHENFIEWQQKAGAAEWILTVFEDIDKQLSAIGALQEQGVEATLVYATGWSKLIDKSVDIFLAFAISLIVIPYIAIEQESGYSTNLSASFRNKQRKRAKFELRKILIALLYSSAVIFVFNLSDILLIHSKFGLPSWNAFAVGAGITFNNIKFKLYQALILKFIFSVFGTGLIIAFAEILKKVTKKTMLLLMIFVGIQVLFLTASTIINRYILLDFTCYFGFNLLFFNKLEIIIQFLVLTLILIINIIAHKCKN